jgi:UDP:flavonoid glycosyltransferase YjiC (YdhE family)
VEDWIDFHELLPRVDAFVCNGGFGSILLALESGVPVLSAGTQEGKSDINARLSYRGLGVDLRTERPTPKQIGRGLSRLMDDGTIRERVSDLQRELAAYDPLEIVERTLAADGIVPEQAVTLSA